MTEHIRIESDDGVLCMTMDRPQKKNALTPDMYAAMTAALEQAAGSDAVRAVLITGTGDSYTAGAGRLRAASSRTIIRLLPTWRVHSTIVAAVNGLAVGIGATMLLHCDLVYAAQNARLRFPFVNLGLVPEMASSVLLPRLAGYHRAAELMLLGDFFTAEEARDIGLVNRVLPAEKLLDHAMDAAKALAAKPREALRQTRALLKGDLAAVLERKQRETEIFEERRESPEAQAIFAAFLGRASR